MQLILAAFSVGPQSVQASDKSDVDEDVTEKDKVDYFKQFVMAKGENFMEPKIKRHLFADLEEFMRAKQL